MKTTISIFHTTFGTKYHWTLIFELKETLLKNDELQESIKLWLVSNFSPYKNRIEENRGIHFGFHNDKYQIKRGINSKVSNGKSKSVKVIPYVKKERYEQKEIKLNSGKNN